MAIHIVLLMYPVRTQNHSPIEGGSRGVLGDGKPDAKHPSNSPQGENIQTQRIAI